MATALTAICKLVSGDSIPAILPQVVDLLGHATDLVRKKAVMALHRFYVRSPSAVSHLLPRFRQMLCDKARARVVSAFRVGLSHRCASTVRTAHASAPRLTRSRTVRAGPVRDGGLAVRAG